MSGLIMRNRFCAPCHDSIQGPAVESAKGLANDAEHRQATHLQLTTYAKEIVTSVGDRDF